MKLHFESFLWAFLVCYWIWFIKKNWIEFRVTKWLSEVKWGLTYFQYITAELTLTKINRTPTNIDVIDGNLKVEWFKGDLGFILIIEEEKTIIRWRNPNKEMKTFETFEEAYVYCMGNTYDELREKNVEIFRKLYSKIRNIFSKERNSGT